MGTAREEMYWEGDLRAVYMDRLQEARKAELKRADIIFVTCVSLIPLQLRKCGGG